MKPEDEKTPRTLAPWQVPPPRGTLGRNRAPRTRKPASLSPRDHRALWYGAVTVLLFVVYVGLLVVLLR